MQKLKLISFVILIYLLPCSTDDVGQYNVYQNGLIISIALQIIILHRNVTLGFFTAVFLRWLNKTRVFTNVDSFFRFLTSNYVIC